MLRSYQSINLNFEMSRLHTGRFSDLHSKFAKIDQHLEGDTEKTRLRTYTVSTMCNLALDFIETSETKASILTAGVSFGTAPLVMGHFLGEKLTGRTLYLIDPFLGVNESTDNRKDSNHNLEPKLVIERMAPGLNVYLVRKFLSPEALNEISSLAFAHLNTGDFDAEFLSLPSIYNKLTKRGFIVFDLYGWLSPTLQERVDNLLNSLGAESFECVTRQLVIYKP